MQRREFLCVAATAPIALSAVGMNVNAIEKDIRTPLIVLWLSGGISAKEFVNPDPKDTASELRGPLQSIPTETTGVHFSEVWPKLASRSSKFSILRALDAGTSDHTPGQQTAILNGSKTFTEEVGEKSANGGVPYVFLNPGSVWAGITEAFQKQKAFTPLWDPREKRFIPPEMKADPRLAEKKTLLDAFDTPLNSPVADKMDKFRKTAFDLLLGGGEFFKALALNPKDRERYGNSLSGDMVLTAKQFIERGAGAVTVYHEPDYFTWDMHKDIGDGMKKLSPEMDHAASMLIDEIASHRLNAVLLMMGEIPRTPAMNSGGNGLPGGRDHWRYGNTAILAGGKIRNGVVHGRTNKRGEIVDGGVQQKSQLGNTVLLATGDEISPALPRVRELL